jgi:hypothetical protein
MISVTHIDGATGQLASSGKLQGSWKIYGNQSNAQCRSLAPTGTETPFAGANLNIKLHPISNADCGGCTNSVSPWRTDEDLDFDDDGCTDEEELSKGAAHPATCGDDPWNPYDSNSTDLAGSWDLIATVRPADACESGTWDGQGSGTYDCTGQPDRTLVPGAYHHCYSFWTQTGSKIAADLLCYKDFGPNTNAFPISGVAPGPGTSLAVNPQQCAGCSGNGRPGAAPPGRTGSSSTNPVLFADIDSGHAHLQGVVDTTNDEIRLWGCLPDPDGLDPLGWTYVSATLHRYTWRGAMSMWTAQGQSECTTGAPTGTPSTLPLEGVLQSNDVERDRDLDGCPDRSELGDVPGTGGLRDPANRWDYMNPTNDSVGRIDDVLAVVEKFGVDSPAPGYDQKYDRGGPITGSNPWNLLPPNGTIRVSDILAAISTYGHDCGSGIDKTTPTPRPTATTMMKVAPPPATPTPTPTP